MQTNLKKGYYEKEKRNKKKKETIASKKGVTLMMLIITIVVLLILVGAVVGTTAIAIDDSKKTTLAQDLVTIEDAVESYYLTNNTLPVKETPIHTLASLKSLIVIDKYTVPFAAEVNTNGDNDAKFFIVDLAKLGVKTTGKGTGAKGDTDIFVVSEKNLNVYYVKGVTSNKQTFFSLTPALVSITKIKQPVNTDDGNNTEITIGGKIKAEKDKKMWTNEMELKLTIDLSNATDTVFMIAGTSPERDITSVVKNTKILKIPENLTAAEKTSLTAKKEIILIKKSNNVETARTNINVSNLDITVPTVSNVIIKPFGDFNTITLENNDTESGFYQVKYEYLQKKNTKGAIVDAYLTNATSLQTVFNLKYMKTYGKIAQSNVVKLPKYISKVQIYIFDKADNFEIRTVELNASNVTNEPDKPVIPDVPDVPDGGGGSSGGGTPSYSNPYIPAGFIHVEGTTIDNGYVIKDSINGNEFVWIPVVRFEDFKLINFGTAVGTETIPAEITTSVKTNGGYYIGRYEQGVGNVSKKGIAVRNNINWNDSSSQGNAMYAGNAQIASTLIYGTMWDTACSWIQSKGFNISDSTSWGNYANNTVSGHGALQATGYSESWKANNIYDLARKCNGMDTRGKRVLQVRPWRLLRWQWHGTRYRPW